MTIKDVHDLILDILRKETSGPVKHETIDRVLDFEQMKLFASRIGDPNEYQPGRPIPMVAYGMTVKVHEDLLPFKESIDFVDTAYNSTTNPYGTGGDGILRLPSDYEALTGIRVSAQDSNGNTRHRSVPVVNEDEVADHLDSFLVAPSATSPICVLAGEVSDQFRVQFFPNDQGHAGTLSYLRRPAKPEFVYTMNGRQVNHDPNASTDLEWKDTVVIELIQRALSVLGVPIEDTLLTQYAENLKQQGV